MPVIDIARDCEGIEQAIGHLLEEGFAFARVRSSIDSAEEDNQDRMIGSLPVRELSPGYYKLGEYLLWLDDVIQTKAAVVGVGMKAFEVEGLRALRVARNEFERRHPQCSSCGARQDSQFAPQCYECGVEFRKR